MCWSLKGDMMSTKVTSALSTLEELASEDPQGAAILAEAISYGLEPGASKLSNAGAHAILNVLVVPEPCLVSCEERNFLTF